MVLALCPMKLWSSSYELSEGNCFKVSIARSLVRSVYRSFDRSIARSLDRYRDRSLDRSFVARSLTNYFGSSNFRHAREFFRGFEFRITCAHHIYFAGVRITISFSSELRPNIFIVSGSIVAATTILMLHVNVLWGFASLPTMEKR